PAAVAQQFRQRDFDAYVRRGLQTLRVPGAAVAVVKDGKLVFAQGSGVCTIGDSSPVDAHTLFQIASNTKAFTTAALAMLVDEGKLAWDDPVTKYLPDFQLYEPYVTREFTLRDLVTHRSGLGLGAGDLLWFHSSYGRAEVQRAPGAGHVAGTDHPADRRSAAPARRPATQFLGVRARLVPAGLPGPQGRGAHGRPRRDDLAGHAGAGRAARAGRAHQR